MEFNNSEKVKRISETIQREDKLNTVSYLDVPGPGNGRHNYFISRNEDGAVICELHFQNGGRNTEGAVDGVLDEDLLEIVRHRLQCFQSGEFPSRESACAITHIEEALMWLNKRKQDRKYRGVLGKHVK